MKIKMTNLFLMDTINMLNKFATVTGKLGYAISKTKGRMEIEFKPFEEERMKLIRKYGTPDENGNYVVKQDNEHFLDFANEVTSIADEIVEIDVHQISAEDFNNSDYFVEDASVRDYDLLKALFVERKEEDVQPEAQPETQLEESVETENEAV